MSVKVVDLVRDAQVILIDDGTRFPVLELQAWLNAGYRETVNLRPDANTLTAVFTCAAGVRQDISLAFPNALKLIEVIRNVAAASNQFAVMLADRQVFDDQRRNWTVDPATISIENYMYDPRLNNQFLVYPPALNTAQLEIVYCEMPQPHALTATQLQTPTTTETIRLLDSYANILLDYVLYRAFSKDAGNPENAARAVAHYSAFKDSLTGKSGSDQAVKPGTA